MSLHASSVRFRSEMSPLYSATSQSATAAISPRMIQSIVMLTPFASSIGNRGGQVKLGLVKVYYQVGMLLGLVALLIGPKRPERMGKVGVRVVFRDIFLTPIRLLTRNPSRIDGLAISFQPNPPV